MRKTKFPIKHIDSCAEMKKGLKNFRDDKGLNLVQRYEIYRHLMKCDECVAEYSKLMDEDCGKLRSKLKRKFS